MTERDPPAQRAGAASGHFAVRRAAHGVSPGRKLVSLAACLTTLAASVWLHVTAPAAASPLLADAAMTHSPYGALPPSRERRRDPLFAILFEPLADVFAAIGQNDAPGEAEVEIGRVRIKRETVENILRAAAITRWDPALLLAIADKESRFQTGVQARTSSATGLFQFIDATWLKVVREFGDRHGLAREAAAIKLIDGEYGVEDTKMLAHILGLRRNGYLSALLAAEMLKRDRERIAQRIGRDLTDGETYLTHFLGPDGAEAFLGAVAAGPQQSAPALFPKPARANKAIFYAQAKGKKKPAARTLADVRDSFEKMMGARLERYRAIGETPVINAYADMRGQ